MKKISLNTITFIPCVVIYFISFALIVIDVILKNKIVSGLLSFTCIVNSMYMIVNYYGNLHIKNLYPTIKNWMLPLSCFLVLVGGTIDLLNIFNHNLTSLDSFVVKSVRNVGLYIYTIWLLYFHTSLRRELQT